MIVSLLHRKYEDGETNYTYEVRDGIAYVTCKSTNQVNPYENKYEIPIADLDIDSDDEIHDALDFMFLRGNMGLEIPKKYKK